jgi:drug/metabolite transporter (DMT)-like permease
MQLHRVSGRGGLGFALAFATMALWGVLPLALEIVLRTLDPATITWVRFTISALLLGVLLAARGGLPPLRRLGAGEWRLLAVATVFLAVNYQGFLVGLDWTTPANAQVMIQLAPLLLAFGGIAVFGERFTRLQGIGVGVLVAGLGLFFAGQVGALAAGLRRHLLGDAVMVAASLTWAVYGLAQKQLLRSLPSQGIMLCIYAGCAVLFVPLAEPASLGALDGLGWALLVFCGLNTLLAYGAFAEALAHREASRVSAVLALTPLATVACTWLAAARWPDLVATEPLGPAALAGACLVVAGSLATSLGGPR